VRVCCVDVRNPCTLCARVACVFAAVCAGLGVAQRTEKLEVLNAIVCAVPVLVLELERHRLVHPHDDPVAFREVHILALVALVRPLEVMHEAMLQGNVVKAAIFYEDLLGRLLEATDPGGEVARVEVEEVGAAHALGLLVPEVVLVAALLHDVEPAGAAAHQRPEALVVDGMQLCGRAWLHGRGRLAEPEMFDRHPQVLDSLQAVRSRVPAAVAIVALAHEFREFRALAHKVSECVVRDIRPRVARREVLCVESEAQDLLLEGCDAAAGAETAELERFATATREVAPAFADAHEIREFLRGDVVHLVNDYESVHMGDKYLFFLIQNIHNSLE